MERQPPHLKPEPTTRMSDPEALILILGIIGGISGISAIMHHEHERQNRAIRREQQRAIRKGVQKHLLDLLADLGEWLELVTALRRLLRESGRDPNQVELRIGGGLLALSRGEWNQFVRLSDRIHALEKSTTKNASGLQDAIDRLDGTSENEVVELERFRGRLREAVDSFNVTVFSGVRSPIPLEYFSGELALRAVDDLVTSSRRALHDLEILLGSEYDRSV